MKWIGERVSFVDDKNKLTIVIYPENITWVKGVMGAWVAMWFTIGVTVIWSYFTFKLTEQEQIIIYIFMAFWAYYALKVTRSFFWLLWGRELLKLDETGLSYKRSIKSYGKSSQYFYENISKMEVHQPKEKSMQAVMEQSPWVKGGERIDFQYFGKTIRFGRKLNQKDTELLFKLITKRIEERLRKSK